MPIEPKIFPGHFRVQWSETMHMLDLCANQLDIATQESGESMELLMDTFASLTDQLDTLQNAATNIKSNGADNSEFLDNCAATKEKVNKIIIGLQFYDRLTQRTHNIRESLAVLAELIDDPHRQNIPEEWVSLRDKIKTKFSKEQQKTIFNALMQGADMDEVFELFD